MWDLEKTSFKFLDGLNSFSQYQVFCFPVVFLNSIFSIADELRQYWFSAQTGIRKAIDWK